MLSFRCRLWSLVAVGCLVASVAVAKVPRFTISGSDLTILVEGGLKRVKHGESVEIPLKPGGTVRVSIYRTKADFWETEFVSRGITEFEAMGQSIKLYDGGSVRARLDDKAGSLSLALEWTDAEVSALPDDLSPAEVTSFFVFKAPAASNDILESDYLPAPSSPSSTAKPYPDLVLPPIQILDDPTPSPAPSPSVTAQRAQPAASPSPSAAQVVAPKPAAQSSPQPSPKSSSTPEVKPSAASAPPVSPSSTAPAKTSKTPTKASAKATPAPVATATPSPSLPPPPPIAKSKVAPPVRTAPPGVRPPDDLEPPLPEGPGDVDPPKSLPRSNPVSSPRSTPVVAAKGQFVKPDAGAPGILAVAIPAPKDAPPDMVVPDGYKRDPSGSSDQGLPAVAPRIQSSINVLRVDGVQPADKPVEIIRSLPPPSTATPSPTPSASPSPSASPTKRSRKKKPTQ